MSLIKKEIKQSSLIHQRIRKASFVPLEPQDSDTFKYNMGLSVSKYIIKKFVALKTFYNKIIQGGRLWLQKIDFKIMRADVSTWLIEAVIEGFVVNYIVWALVGLKFNLITMLAWGFATKQLLSIYRRLKDYGSVSKIPQKDK